MVWPVASGIGPAPTCQFLPNATTNSDAAAVAAAAAAEAEAFHIIHGYICAGRKKSLADVCERATSSLAVRYCRSMIDWNNCCRSISFHRIWANNTMSFCFLCCCPSFQLYMLGCRSPWKRLREFFPWWKTKKKQTCSVLAVICFFFLLFFSTILRTVENYT